MIYLFGWLMILFFLFVQEIARYRGKVLLIFLLIFFCTLSFIRGDVGTDTVNYEIMFYDFTSNYNWDGREPLFVVLANVLSYFSPTIEIAVRATSFVFFGLIACFVFVSNRNERFLLMSYILPAFVYQYGMNGLRLGIASALFLIAVQFFSKRGKMPAVLSALASIFFHYSMIFSVLFVVFTQRPWLKFSSVLGGFFLLVCAIGGLMVIDIYVGSKFDNYKEMQALGSTSGLSKIVPMAFIVLGVFFSNLPRVERTKVIITGTLLISGAWVVTQFSYAGLRLLDLLAFSLPLAVLATYSRLNLDFNRPLKLFMILAGLLSAAGLWRGFMLDYGVGDAPFMPYQIFNFNGI
ncbi:hypothetical protein LCGC14_0323960 [marine sediment metagenome]|uniref:EpsG family protein n=1 Tax=marine sediment metagenome TaxID=412755 RepID=A0A0F9TIF1_9ZZZZ|nr:EpsG family protein [Halomonas sp.]